MWKGVSGRDYLMGCFVWTGFDYRGEPTPYSWPCINSHFGIMDTCGFPKDNYWYYQAWWSDKPVLHLFPHWNWPGKEGQEIDVKATSRKVFQGLCQVIIKASDQAGDIELTAISPGLRLAHITIRSEKSRLMPSL